MFNYLYAEINIVSGMVLILMLANKNKLKTKSSLPVDQQIFNGVMFLNLLIFLFDTGMWMSDGASGSLLMGINYLSTTLYYALNPIICLFWLLYTDYRIYENKAGLLRRARIYAIPAAVCTVMSLASPFTGWFFSITEKNVYIRGRLFLIMGLVTIAYLIYSSTIAIKDLLENDWNESKKIDLSLILFPAIVSLAAIMQIKFFGLSIIWVCAMLACTTIYINIQNSEIYTDYLTGLYNRRRFEQHLQRKIHANNKDSLLFVVVLDVNKFKKINDTYGHMEGDAALIKVAELLKKSCEKGDDFVARFGGDEFIIIGERFSIAEIEMLIAEINSNFDDYNKNHTLKYTLSLSMGYSLFNEKDTEDSFLAAADKKMYAFKQNNENGEQ